MAGGDWDAITAAIAARYTGAAITAAGGAPAGLQNVRRATADLPPAIGAVPTVLVFPDSGTLRTGGGTRAGEATVFVRFYFGVARNLARELNACRKWLPVLLRQHLAAMQLGGTVDRCTVVGWRIAALPYGAKTYTGIELRLLIVTTEPWVPSS